jgi:hypothetical protein
VVNWVCGTEKGKPVGSKGNQRVYFSPVGFAPEPVGTGRANEVLANACRLPNMRHEANFAPAEHHVAIHI